MMKEICIWTDVRDGLADRCCWYVGISSAGRLVCTTVAIVGGGGVERPEGALRMRRRCLNDVVRGMMGVAQESMFMTQVVVVMGLSVAGWVTQATPEGWHVRGTD
jgi:hypothetical protein